MSKKKAQRELEAGLTEATNALEAMRQDLIARGWEKAAAEQAVIAMIGVRR